MALSGSKLHRIASAVPGLHRMALKCSSQRSSSIAPHSHLRAFSSTERTVHVAQEMPSNSNRTVDASEVNKFKSLGGDWWHPNGSFKLLHSMNDLRVPFIRDGIAGTGIVPVGMLESSRPLSGVSILDVGCGGGILSEPLARLGANVTGIDAAEESVEAAKAHNKIGANLSYICGSVEDHSASAAEKYDAIVASEVIEHVSSVDSFINECNLCLKPGGSLFITTMNKTTLSFLGAIVTAEYLMREVPVGTHDWNKFVKPEQLAKMLRSKGYNVRMIHGMLCFPPANRWCWVSDTSINYALHAVKSSEG